MAHCLRIPTLGHHGGRLHQQLVLVVRVVGARIRNIVQHLLPIQPEPKMYIESKQNNNINRCKAHCIYTSPQWATGAPA